MTRHRRNNATTPVTCSGRLQLDKQTQTILFELARTFCNDLRRVYTKLVVDPDAWFVKGNPTGSLRSQMIDAGWSQREAQSMRVTASGMQASLIEVTKLNLATSKEALERAQTRMLRCPTRRKHGLGRRIQKLRSRIRRIERALSKDTLRVTFGSRRLVKAGNDPVKAGYVNRAQWRDLWDRARANQWVCVGDKECSNGNASAKIELDAVDPVSGEIGDQVTIRIPPQVQKMPGAPAFITIPVNGFDYRRTDLAWALAPTIESLSNRAIARAEAQAQRAAGEKKVRTRPTTLYTNSPVTVRISWNEDKQAWYIHASCQPAPVKLQPYAGLVLGVDTNPDHLAWCLVNRQGNPIKWGKVDIDLTGSGNRNVDRIGVAVKQLMSIAVEHGAAIACEKLDFSKARSGFRYLPNKLAKLLSSFAYRRVLSILASRAQRQGVQVLPVNPAWTSVLGQTNYAATYGVSVDQGAACVIARRSLGLRNTMRPVVRARVQAKGAQGRPCASSSQHPVGTDQTSLIRAAKKLPKRSSTWERDGLCARSVRPDPFEPLVEHARSVHQQAGEQHPNLVLQRLAGLHA